MERDILKKSRGIFREGVDMKYAIIEELRLQYPVQALCHQMELSESGYYNWRSRPLSRRQQDDTHLKVVIKAAHKRTRETFGPERLQQDIVKNEGMQVGVHRIKRLHKELGIRCRQNQKFKATTNSNHSLPVAPNFVDQKFDGSRYRCDDRRDRLPVDVF